MVQARTVLIAKPFSIYESRSNGKSGGYGFQISSGEKFIIVEDVVTRGGHVQEAIDIVRAHGRRYLSRSARIFLCHKVSAQSCSVFPLKNEVPPGRKRWARSATKMHIITI